MFFKRLTKVVAWGAIALGAISLALGFFIAFQADTAIRAAMTARYLGSKTTGEYIDRGFYLLIFGVILGAVLKFLEHSSKIKT